ncbi:hypothetical protein KUCAC02_009015 [Chaenocephalus aceratus]|uniref:Uncharacterized protein n=1 Tax=Chaenocephalus aceratus TaxID=36190 RepID=A0ACB9WSR3_CHAAC|nr:hypothetical protein KUCAC02_009015 [Chaenocephalus aceratus]
MPKNQRPKPGSNASDSPEEDTAGSLEPLSDTQAIMMLVDKTEDLESRQRRDNCRLVGVAEGTGNIRPEKAIAQLLQDALSLDYTPTLDRAHRGLQPKPADGDAPRPIIIKFHYFQEKADIIRKAMGAGPIFHNGKHLHLPGLHTLATLKITTSTGEQKSFEDPTKAKHYIETDLHPRDPEGE